MQNSHHLPAQCSLCTVRIFQSVPDQVRLYILVSYWLGKSLEKILLGMKYRARRRLTQQFPPDFGPVAGQRDFFNSGGTGPIRVRIFERNAREIVVSIETEYMDNATS